MTKKRERERAEKKINSNWTEQYLYGIWGGEIVKI